MPTQTDSVVQFIRDPQRPEIELRYSHYPRNAFHKHTHADCSVGLVCHGRTRFHLYTSPEQELLIRAQEISLINSGEVHACNPLPGSDLTYYMLYIRPAFMEEIAASLPNASPGGGGFRFCTPLVQDRALFHSLVQTCQAIFRRAGRLEIETGLFTGLTEIAMRFGTACAVPREPTAVEGLLQRSCDYLMDHLPAEISLQDLAALSGLSPYYFVRAFRSRYGLPPHTYQLQQRIELSKRLLSHGRPIAAVAAEVGFADQSHFTRKFKMLVGATPRQYQRAAG
jgi:AraC-like DNA-binding protein